MRAVDLVRKKRDGHPLTREEIVAFVDAATSKAWADYQVSAMLMAIFLRGMDADETAHLTQAMACSGKRLDLSDIPGPKVDKHSTGGVGDKTSLVLAPLAAACGIVVPMMSGRGLGHSGGTLDKLEAIPGFRTHLSVDEFRGILREVGCAMIGQTADVAPADKALYALRDVTATVESIPLITASILSKKLAEGIDGLVLDVKCGQGAFMKLRDDAEALAESLVHTGRHNGLRIEALLTAMDVPLGRAVGNALEAREAIEALRGNGPKDLVDLSVALAARMLRLAGLAGLTGPSPLSPCTQGERVRERGGSSLDAAEACIRWALSSGEGLQRMRLMIETQGGDPRVADDVRLLPAAPRQHLLRAKATGHVQDIHAEMVGRAAVALGAGRDRAEDAVDPAVGIVLTVECGASVKAGEPIAEVHYRDEARLGKALPLLDAAWTIGEARPVPAALILQSWEEVRLSTVSTDSTD